MSQAFEGVRVVDFTQVVAGPVATYQLGLLGAEVVKIESAAGGDIARGMLDLTGFGRGEMAPAFIGVNHNKRSLAVDLKRPEGRAAVRRIVRRADVLVENFKPGVIGRLGFDYETVRELRPSIVYCSISGYGQEGPRRSMAAFDGAIQAASGMMMANGHAETGPTRTVSPIIDVTTGMMAAFAIAAALRRREETGSGQFLDVAMLDSAVSLLNPLYNNHLATGEEPELLGNQSLTRYPTANVFPTGDGYVQITALTGAQVDRLLEVLGCPELRDDPRFATDADLVANGEEMRPELCKRLRREPTRVWLERLEAAGVPAAPLSSFREVMAHPQLETRRLTATLPAPGMLGRAEVTSVTTGYVADAGGPAVRTFAPRLGEHSREILAEHGCSEAEIEALHAAGVVRGPDPADSPPVPAGSRPSSRAGAGGAAGSAPRPPAAAAAERAPGAPGRRSRMPAILITGTSTGIGLATALRFARAGYRTWATMRDLAKAGPLREARESEGLDLELLRLDVTDPASIRDAVAEALPGGLDVLVNNAGWAGGAPLEVVPEEQHRAMFEANYFGAVRMIRAVLPHMRERRSGTIVNLTSIAGRIAMPNQVPYTASKWALEGASEALAHEVRRFGVRVKIIEPGVILTNIFENAKPQTVFDRSSPYVDLMRRNGKFYSAGQRANQPPEIVADAILDAVESDSDRLRYVVGADAESILRGRTAMRDEEWVAMGADLSDDDYNAEFRARFGIELR